MNAENAERYKELYRKRTDRAEKHRIRQKKEQNKEPLFKPSPTSVTKLQPLPKNNGSMKVTNFNENYITGGKKKTKKVKKVRKQTRKNKKATKKNNKGKKGKGKKTKSRK